MFTALMLEKHRRMLRMPEEKGDFMAVFSAFFVLECIYFVALLKTRSKVAFWMNVILCFMLFVCIYIERPICRICFKRRMKLQRKEEKNHGELHQTRI